LEAVITALTANPATWAKTVLFVTYDENGGFFDHVPPTTAPPGTPGEYLTVPAVPDPTLEGNPAINGPIGLGFRVPMTIVSPFSRGGFVSSDMFDHTSILSLIEWRWGLAPLTVRDASANNLALALDFGKPDRWAPPYVIDPGPYGAACPNTTPMSSVPIAGTNEWIGVREVARSYGWNV